LDGVDWDNFVAVGMMAGEELRDTEAWRSSREMKGNPAKRSVFLYS